MEISNFNQHDIPVAYPPPPAVSQPAYVMAPPPPIGYPTKEGSEQEGYSKNRTPAETTSRGEGFWKGCVAAICCCWVLEFCFGC